ncbi:helix-turn-helix transcriptional regulator [Amycolatopsis sp. FBCC-B4732]|uniref:helix-turn-helix domain-containing protein n=1 Tax=Amycolatopsis sp. FBCC-B4732 TaxID=3079339 RepID=UPI001FF234FE|nr:helix-turn-helix transcriptional regulator [Amycolatopsis sp. FBCC-B4732]UOX85319.1 helix-turn-helix transcriptional regulator [Amycolatopsis sp. FBCC-B4732]
MQDERARPDAAPEETVGAQAERTFISRMREIRKEQDISQAALARRLIDHGVELDASAITRIERGARVIRFGEAVAIAAALGTTLLEMSRFSSIEEQIEEAERDLAEAKAAHATTSYELKQAVDRLEHLRSLLAEIANAPEPPIVKEPSAAERATGFPDRIYEDG